MCMLIWYFELMHVDSDLKRDNQLIDGIRPVSSFKNQTEIKIRKFSIMYVIIRSPWYA